MSEYADDVEVALASLRGLLLTEEDLHTTLQRVAQLACASLPNCSGVGVTLIEHGRPTTAAVSDPEVDVIDAYQYEAGDGPCLSSFRDQRVNRVEDLAASERWPEFTRRAVAAGIGSVLSVPLSVREQPIGALNIYSRHTAAFDASSEHRARAYADEAAVALANAQTHEASTTLAAHLESALASRATIDQAIGILLGHAGGTPDECFHILRTASQRENRKLRDLAGELVDAARAGTLDTALRAIQGTESTR